MAQPATHAPPGRLRLRPGLVLDIALSSARVRILRSLLTVLTIATACAFLLYLQLTPPGETAADRDARSLLLVLASVVSAAGVLNTMLMSVTQRWREIGTMKCLGALDSFILAAVVLEAALLGLAGGLIGAPAGFLFAIATAAWESGSGALGALDLAGWPAKAAFSIAAGVALAVIGTLPPALVAARLPPMDAMRGDR